MTKNSEVITPMMQQFLEIKKHNTDHLLFFRMGDFYELFFEDAQIASDILDITLTKRGTYLNKEIPMCGVPFHASDFYLNKLIAAGLSVAICEQMESPEEAKKRGYKAVVQREVVRIITAGTVMDDLLLSAKENNYLLVIIKNKDQIALAGADITLGEFFVESLDEKALTLEIARLSPKEIIISDSLAREEDFLTRLQKFPLLITKRPDSLFDFMKSKRQILDYYKIDFLIGLGDFNKEEIIAAGALLEYLIYTQKKSLPKLKNLSKISPRNFMELDPATRSHLELIKTIRGEDKGLLSIIDHTITAPGSRLLNFALNSPLLDKEAINTRLDNVAVFLEKRDIRKKIRQNLNHFPDLERSLARINAKRFSLKDLFAIRDGLQITLDIANFTQSLTPNLQVLIRSIPPFDKLLQKLTLSLVADINDINERTSLIQKGYNATLDKLYSLKNNSHDAFDKLRDKYRQETGVNSLKITRNNIIGYYIEVTASQAPKIDNPLFKLKQSLGNSVRYTSEELQSLENDLILCHDKIDKLEQSIISELYEAIAEKNDSIISAAIAVANLDFIAALAELAEGQKWTRPILDYSKDFQIVGGYHPMVKLALGSDFTANNTHLSDKDRIWLITGPNMAGKSTFLRQNALIALLAQMGSFVPAKSAKIGIVDKLFSRIGASDNISSGQSTFMVEMLETAYITNQATERSLIIMDEIGRGTSTYDGLAIAKSLVEFLHNTSKARLFFATHYHEICNLEEQLPFLSCHTMRVSENQNKINFLHEVILGRADKSYGVQVAQLAGLPEDIIKRADEILNQLEKGQEPPKEDKVFPTKLVEILKVSDPNNLTPMAALDLVFQLKSLVTVPL
jgi:DNA mismatch repair protein MutS